MYIIIIYFFSKHKQGSPTSQIYHVGETNFKSSNMRTDRYFKKLNIHLNKAHKNKSNYRIYNYTTATSHFLSYIYIHTHAYPHMPTFMTVL